MSRPPLSIIIPTLNAMPRLGDCLAALVAGLSDGLVREAIVVDGASSDQSAQLAADMGCKVIALPPELRGRGRQLRAGAETALGDWLLFLHADTALQDGWVRAVADHMANHPDKAAYFKLAFDQSSAGARRVAKLANMRAKTFGLPYGDQGLLITRALYNQIGGFSDIPLMEDVDIVRRLGRSRLIGLAAIAQTSGEKFAKGGWWATPIRNLMLIAAYRIGVSPYVLARWYK
jgi:rSAM/selenodomain-associated transferase 2